MKEKPTDPQTMLKYIKKIQEGCEFVKVEDGIHEDAKRLASLIIRDCNFAMGKIK